MRFKIDLKIFIFLILFYFTKQMETYVVIMVFAIIHELGHLVAGLALGMIPESIKLMPYGLSISFKLIPKDYNKKIGTGNLLEIKKIIVATAGPLTNFFIILIIFNLKIDLISNLIIVYANLLIIIFNLLPIYPLDGGRILKSILNLLKGKRKSEIIINRVSNIFLFLIIFVFSILIYYLKNISILFIMIYLLYLVTRENKIHRMKMQMYKIIDEG